MVTPFVVLRSSRLLCIKWECTDGQNIHEQGKIRWWVHLRCLRGADDDGGGTLMRSIPRVQGVQ